MPVHPPSDNFLSGEIMSEYQDLIKREAKKFVEANRPAFVSDEGEHGGKTDRPNFAKWLDRTHKLNGVVEEIASKWAHKDLLWVQSNTRNPNPHGGGDQRSKAFGSFYLDLLHEVKKLFKQA